MRTTTVKIRRGLGVGFKVRGQLYVKVNLSERYPDRRGCTLGQLGADLVVHPQRILKALLSNDSALRAINANALEALFERHHQITELTHEVKPVLSRREKREHLVHLATGLGAFEMRGRARVREEPTYFGWTLPERLTIAVPLSQGLVDVIDKSERWAAIELQVEAFERKLYELADSVIELRKALSDLCAAGELGLHEVGMLVGLSQYCDLLLDQQGNPEPGESPLADFQEFLQRSAIPLLSEKLLRNPVDLAPKAAARRDRHARKIMMYLDDPELTAGVTLVVDNHDLVPHSLLDTMYHYLTAAADLLSATDQAEVFAHKHAAPMMRGLAELPATEYEATIEHFGDPGLQAAMAYGWRDVLPERETVFKLAMGIGSAIIGSVSNLEGPRSIGVAVIMQYQLHLFDKAAKEYTFSVAAYDRATQLFMRHFGDLDGHNLEVFRRKLAAAVQGGKKVDIAAIAKNSNLVVTRGPFRGRTTRSLMMMLALSTLGLTIASDPDATPSSVLSVASTAGTMGVATLDWPPIASALEKRWGRSFTRTAGGLAGLAAVAALGSSFFSLTDAITRNDGLEILEGALSSVGSASSLVGWLWSTKAGALALAPSMLMTLGSALVFAGLGVSLWRIFEPIEPSDIVNTTLDQLHDERSRASIAELRPTVDTLTTMADKVEFLPLGPSYEKALVALGYDPTTIAALRGVA